MQYNNIIIVRTIRAHPEGSGTRLSAITFSPHNILPGGNYSSPDGGTEAGTVQAAEPGPALQPVRNLRAQSTKYYGGEAGREAREWPATAGWKLAEQTHLNTWLNEWIEVSRIYWKDLGEAKLVADHEWEGHAGKRWSELGCGKLAGWVAVEAGNRRTARDPMVSPRLRVSRGIWKIIVSQWTFYTENMWSKSCFRKANSLIPGVGACERQPKDVPHIDGCFSL